MGTGIAAPCTKVVHPSVKWINLWDLPIEAISQNRHHRWVLLTHLTLVKSKVQPQALAGSPAIPIFLLAVYFVLNIPWHHSTTRSTLHWWLHWCCLMHPYRISFVKFTTNLHPALKLTWTISGNSPPFLDLPITGVYLSTDIEPTDTPRCLDYTSSHPPLASMPVWEKVQTRSILCPLPLQMLPDPLSSSSTWCFTQDSNICSFLSHQHH